MAQKDGILLIAEPFYPGWQAYLGGRGVEPARALDALMQVETKAGPVDLRFIYRPWSWLIGLWTTLAVLAAMSAASLRRVQSLTATR